MFKVLGIYNFDLVPKYKSVPPFLAPNSNTIIREIVYATPISEMGSLLGLFSLGN